MSDLDFAAVLCGENFDKDAESFAVFDEDIAYNSVMDFAKSLSDEDAHLASLAEDAPLGSLAEDAPLGSLAEDAASLAEDARAGDEACDIDIDALLAANADVFATEDAEDALRACETLASMPQQKRSNGKFDAVCYGCDLGLTYGNTKRKGFRIIDGERRTMCHFCFGNIFQLVGGYAHTNYESAAEAPELSLRMCRSEMVAIMSTARTARELKKKRKPARDFTECVQEAKQSKMTKLNKLYGHNISAPAFERNLIDAFNSCVRKHGLPGTSNAWKYWKQIGLVALKLTFADFDKDPKKCTALGNVVKTKLATLGVLG